MNRISNSVLITNMLNGGGQNKLNPYQINNLNIKTIEIISRNRYIFL